jgi:hypothetical protein
MHYQGPDEPPQAEEQRRLGPPRRRPPTAVGTATPPPPRWSAATSRPVAPPLAHLYRGRRGAGCWTRARLGRGVGGGEGRGHRPRGSGQPADPPRRMHRFRDGAGAGGCGGRVDGSGRVSAYSGESRNHLPNVALKLTRASKDAGLRHAAHSLTTSRGPARSYSSLCRMEVP